ncbi:MAG: AAA family ATPase [Pirellulaceae bacterium]|nr:AAA family ATPase [Pirellulaceae bacterium]
MYLTHLEIKDVKCFSHETLNFAHQEQDYSGWNVILGGNGTGKSTLLQGMALALVGPLIGQRLLYNASGWARQGKAFGELCAGIAPGQHDSAVGQPRKKPYTAAFAVTGDATIDIEGQTYDQPQLVQMKDDKVGLSKGPYAANKSGWLACGYGPFRRLTGMGGSEEYDLVYSSGRGKRFATLFREGAAITNCTEWLVSLYTRSIDPHQSEPERIKFESDLKQILEVINGLLPGGVRIAKVDAKNVYFNTVGGVEVTVPELSDGYRSFLALAIDLLRHTHESVHDLSSVVSRIDDITRVTMDGVVLIDEVDAHLHPRWQREIGFRLCNAFPQLQFIVTSHSPFVAQAASENGLFVLRQLKGQRFVEVLTDVKSTRGWSVGQVLTNPSLFDLEGTRDEETERLMREHSELVAKREWQQLSGDEQSRLVVLEKELAERLTAPGESTDEIKRQELMREYVEKTLNRLEATK